MATTERSLDRLLAIYWSPALIIGKFIPARTGPREVFFFDRLRLTTRKFSAPRSFSDFNGLEANGGKNGDSIGKIGFAEQRPAGRLLQRTKWKFMESARSPNIILISETYVKIAN